MHESTPKCPKLYSVEQKTGTTYTVQFYTRKKRQSVVVDFNFHLTLHIHSNKQTEHCKHSQQTEKLSSKRAIGNNTNSSSKKTKKGQNVSLTIPFTFKSIIWWRHMITRQESHCGTRAFFKRDSNMYKIQYQQPSSGSKSRVSSYLRGSLFFFKIQQFLDHDKRTKMQHKIYWNSQNIFTLWSESHILKP